MKRELPISIGRIVALLLIVAVGSKILSFGIKNAASDVNFARSCTLQGFVIGFALYTALGKMTASMRAGLGLAAVGLTFVGSALVVKLETGGIPEGVLVGYAYAGAQAVLTLLLMSLQQPYTVGVRFFPILTPGMMLFLDSKMYGTVAIALFLMAAVIFTIREIRELPKQGQSPLMGAL